MHSDPLFFRLFKELPGCFFQLVGRPGGDAERYTLEAIEYKATAVRLDGVFRPLVADAGPAYLWEAQFYASDKFYANLLTKIGRFLEHGDPAQDWTAVVIYPTRAVEQKNLRPYQFLLDSDRLIRIYLNELRPAPPDQFEMGILELIAAKPDESLEKANAIIPRVRSSGRSEHVRRSMLQFIETVMVHQFPKWSRAEIEKMIQVTDARQTRVFQEGLEEGREQGREEARGAVARRLLEIGRPVAEIVKATGLSAAQVRKLKKSRKE